MEGRVVKGWWHNLMYRHAVLIHVTVPTIHIAICSGRFNDQVHFYLVMENPTMIYDVDHRNPELMAAISQANTVPEMSQVILKYDLPIRPLKRATA